MPPAPIALSVEGSLETRNGGGLRSPCRWPAEKAVREQNKPGDTRCRTARLNDGGFGRQVRRQIPGLVLDAVPRLFNAA